MAYCQPCHQTLNADETADHLRQAHPTEPPWPDADLNADDLCQRGWGRLVPGEHVVSTP